MTDQEIISSLISQDPKVTAQFFFKECRPLFISVIRQVFEKRIVDYDEIVSELYILLMENDAKRLRSFKFESTLYQWLKTIAIRYCMLLKKRGRVIENESKEILEKADPRYCAPPAHPGGLYLKSVSYAQDRSDDI